jgi:membrane protein DedA with SNARE-associated domain
MIREEKITCLIFASIFQNSAREDPELGDRLRCDAIVGQRVRARLFAGYFLFAVISAYVISQLGFLGTVIAVVLMLSAILLWRKRRREDFKIASYLHRVFISLMCALVFFTSYLIVRATQPSNYRAEDLAALAVLGILLASYFGWIGRDRRFIK